MLVLVPGAKTTLIRLNKLGWYGRMLKMVADGIKFFGAEPEI